MRYRSAFLLSTVLGLSLNPLMSQFVEVGTNTISDWNQGPIYRASAASTLDYSRHSYLFTASELGLPGGAIIDSVQFYKVATGKINVIGDAAFEMYMENTGATSFSSGDIWSNITSTGTQVVNRAFNFNLPYPFIPGNLPDVAGWVSFPITPYIYTGNTLRVSVSWDCSALTTGNPTDGAISWWQDGGVTDKTMGSASATPVVSLPNTGTFAGRRPVIRIYYTLPPPVVDDAGIASIDSPTGLIAPGAQPLNVTLQNSGTNSLASVNVFYDLNGTTFGPISWPGTGLPLASGASEANVTIASPTFLLGTNTLKVWTSAPNGLSDNNVFNDTAYATLEACNVLGGTYTINSAGGGDYLSLNDAYAAMLSCGINAPVVFNVAPGSGPYNERVVMTAVNGASTTNTITFNGNGTTWQWGTAVSADRAACLIDGATDITVNDFIFDMNGTYGHGVHLWNDAQRITISNNTINHPVNNTSVNHSGITSSNSLTSAATTGVSNADYITIVGNTIRNAYYGIRLNGSTNVRDRDCIVQNNTVLDSYAYSIYLNYMVLSTVDGNEITATNRTTGTSHYGLYLNNCARMIATNNYIHDLLPASLTSTTLSCYGIYILGGTNDFWTRVENNIVSNLSNPSGTSGTYYGIYNSGQDTVLIYHNTIIEAVPTWSGSGAQYAMYITATDQTGTEVKSNIINLARPSTSTANYAIWYAETTPLNYPVSNYNALFQSDTITGSLARLGSTNYNNLASWSLQGFDANSIFEFAAPAGSGDFTPTNANLNDAADPAVLVALDYNGATRPLGVNPDPGAIEFEPPAIDATLTWVAPVAPASAGNQTVTVNLSNSSGSTQNITTANLTYTNGVTPVTESFGPISIAPGANLDLSFVAPYNLVAASNLRAWINTVNGTADPVAGNDTTATISICPGFAGGTYTIGATGDYPTIAAAAAALDCGIIGPVVFNVLPGSGPYTDRVVTNQVFGASATNTITFNGNGEMLQWNSSVSDQRAAWLVNGTDFLTINNFVIDVPVGPTSPATYGHGIHLLNDANNVRITNNTITCAVGSTSINYTAICASGTLTSAATLGNNADSLVIENNQIAGGYYSIRLQGLATASPDSNVVVRNNVVKDFYLYGIYYAYEEGGLVKGNDIHRLTNATVSTFYGLYLGVGSQGITMDGNRIHNPSGASPGLTVSCYGIYMSGADAPANNPNTIQNNLIYGWDNGGTATTYGLYSSTSDHCNIWHNTFLFDQTGLSSGVVYGIYQSTTALGFDVRNNIVEIASSGTGTKRCVYYATTTTAVTSDYNDLLMASTGGSANYTGTYGSTNYNTLLDWQGANSNAFDQNSVAADPAFVDPTSDLTPTSGSLNNVCAATVLVANDFNGVARPLGVLPDMGAIEFTPPTLDANITWVAPVNPVAAGPATVTVSIDNAVSSIPNISSLNLTYSDGVNPPVTQQFTSLAIAPGTSGQVSFTTPFAITTSHTLRAWINTVNGVVDAFQTNDTTNYQSICTALSGTYVIDLGGSGDYLTIADFASALSVCGISGPVTANVLAGSGPYTDRVVFASIPGSSAINTVTLNGNGETLLWSTTNSSERAAILMDAASYVTIDDLVVIVPDASTYGFGIQQTNGCRHNTIRNCAVTLPTNSTSTNFAGIVSSGSLTSATGLGGACMYTTVEDNTITGGYYAVTFYSESSTVPDTGNVVRNNVMQDFYLYGGYYYGQNALEVSGNDINRATRGTVSTFYGSYFTTYGRGMNITGNRIHEANGTTTCYGLYFTSVDGTASEPNIVSNNAIYDLRNTSTNYGFYNSGSDHAKYYHNTVVLDNQSATTAAVYGLYQTTTATGVDVRNNIVYISTSGTGTKRCLWFPTTASTITSNYNNLVMLSTGGTINSTGTWGTTNYSTLLDWQGANSSAFDQNSIAVDPGFYAPNNPTPSAAGAQNLGDPTLGILVDINGTVRPLGSGPDMGAIEFNLPDCPLPSGFGLSNATLSTMEVTWTSGAGNSNFTIEYGTSGFTPGTGTTISGPLPVSLPLVISGLSPSSTYDVYLTESCTAGSAPAVGPQSISTIGLVNSFPYCQSFDSWANCGSTSNCIASFCNLPNDWTQAHDGSDDGDWNVEDGTTSSSGTGPTNDNTTGTPTGKFMYLEASSPCGLGTKAVMEPPAFVITSMTNSPELTFAYHMYGSQMGSLTFEYEEPYQSNNWVTLWTRTGQQQISNVDPWKTDSVGVFASGDTVRIRIVGISGGIQWSDMAIDDICLREGPCDYPSYTASTVCNPVDTTYTIDLNITTLGSPGTVSIDTTTTNGTGTAVASVLAPGVYTVGPFPNLSDVTIAVRNSYSPLCVNSVFVDGPDCTPPPINDTCANVNPALTSIGVGSNVLFNGTTTGATDDAGYISSGFLGANYEGYVWESFTTTTCLDLVIDLCGTSPAYGQAASFLIPQCGGIPIFRVVGDFTTCGTGNYTAFWNTLPPGTYYYPVLYDAQTNNNGPYQLRVRGFAPQTPCTPNTCLEATPLTCGVPVSGTNASNTATQGPSVCLPNHVAPGPDAWYSYTATGNDLITASTCVGTNYNSMLTVYAGAPDCSSLTCITGNDDGCGVVAGASEAKWIATSGTTYYIAVHGPLGYVGATGVFSLQVSCEPACTPQPNDLCAGAQTLVPVISDNTGTPATGSNVCAFADANPTCSVSGITASSAQGVWYTFNSGPYGSLFLTLEDDDINAAYTATSLSYALYSGSCGALTQVACVTAGEGTHVLNSLVSGTDYYLMVYNTGGLGTEGTFGILLEYPAQNDAGITSINTPTGLTCGTLVTPVVELKNFGEQPLTSVTINYSVDFGTPVSYVWNGNLNFNATVQVTLPTSTVPQGFHFLDVSTSLPNGQVDEVPSNDGQSGTFDASGEEVRLVLNLDNYPTETTWEIYDAFFLLAASGGSYTTSNTQVVETICLALDFGNCFSLYIYDSFGDGMCCSFGLGSWEVQNPLGQTLLGDVFHGSGLSPDGLPDPGTVNQTPSITPASASYFAHEFCLPAGPATVLPSECGVYTNNLQSKVYCQAVAGVSDYQFEFSNPDAGFRRRIGVSGRNWVKFSEMVTTPLVPGTHYFTRVRADQGFAGFFDDSFGAGCEMGLDPNQVPGCTQLIDDTSLPTHSCNTTKLFGAGDKIYALPTVGATQYRFKFENAGEGFVRVMTRPNYICLLNWTTLPLQVGVTYSVKVEVLVNGIWSGYCGAACNLTIGAPAAQGSASRDLSATDDTNSDLLIWPNPVLNGQVNILLSDIADAEQNITIDVIDLFGKRVHAQQFKNSGEVFNTLLELDGLAAGVYAVTITVNDRVITERITVQ